MLQFPAWKMTLVVAVCLIGILYAVPNFFKTEFGANLPNFAPGKRVSLGLDLQGGSYLLLKVDLDVVIKEYLEEISMEVRKKLRKSRVLKHSSIPITLSNLCLPVLPPSRSSPALSRALPGTLPTHCNSAKELLRHNN